MNNKAQLGTIMVLMDLVLLIIIFYFSASFIDQATESTTLEKNYLIKDLPLFTDTVISLPGEIIAEYDQNTFWFGYDFNKNIITLDDPAKNKQLNGFYSSDNNMGFTAKTIAAYEDSIPKPGFFDKYLSVFSHNVPTNIEHPIITFHKNDNMLNIFDSNKEDNLITVQTCPKNYPNFALDEKTIFLDILDNDQAFDAGFYIYNSLETEAEKIYHNRATEFLEPSKIKTSISTELQDSEIIIILETGQNQIKVYSNSAFSDYIACSLKAQKTTEPPSILPNLDFSEKTIITIHVSEDTQKLAQKISQALVEAQDG
jgi:hypothetical protein